MRNWKQMMKEVNTIEEVLDTPPLLHTLTILDAYYAQVKHPLPIQDVVWAIRGVVAYSHRFALSSDISIKTAVYEALQALSRLKLVHQVNGGIVAHPNPDLSTSPLYQDLRTQAATILKTLRIV